MGPAEHRVNTRVHRGDLVMVMTRCHNDKYNDIKSIIFQYSARVLKSLSARAQLHSDAPIHTHPILANSIQAAPSCPPATYHHLEEGDLGARTLRLMPPASGAHRC